MKKLKLDIDTLNVQSFGSGGAPAGRGTVRGRGGDTVIPYYCYPDSNIMDCPYDPSHQSCGCVTEP
jgi:hypothetical protein